MADFRSLDDIERTKAEEQRKEFKEKIVSDANEVFGGIMKKRKEEKEMRKKKRKWYVKLMIALMVLGLFVLIFNFVLANIWVFKFFIKDLFNIK